MKSKGLVFLMLGCQPVSLYSLTFFNLSSDTIELHASMDVMTDLIAMHALLRPHTNVTWQAPQASQVQLTIAVQQYKGRSTIKAQEASRVYTSKTPVVPSFSPWQKTTTLVIKPARYSPGGLLRLTDCVLIRQEKSGHFVAMTVGKHLGLVALQRYQKIVSMRHTMLQSR